MSTLTPSQRTTLFQTATLYHINIKKSRSIFIIFAHFSKKKQRDKGHHAVFRYLFLLDPGEELVELGHHGTDDVIHLSYKGNKLGVIALLILM